MHVAVEPAAGGELVLDQPVGGRGVGHAQQRLGQHHQRQAFFGRERIGVQKIVDAAKTAETAARFGADRLDQFFARARRSGVRHPRHGRHQRAAPPRDLRPAAQTAPEKSVAQNRVQSLLQFILPGEIRGGVTR